MKPRLAILALFLPSLLLSCGVSGTILEENSSNVSNKLQLDRIVSFLRSSNSDVRRDFLEDRPLEAIRQSSPEACFEDAEWFGCSSSVDILSRSGAIYASLAAVAQHRTYPETFCTLDFFVVTEGQSGGGQYANVTIFTESTGQIPRRIFTRNVPASGRSLEKALSGDFAAFCSLVAQIG